MAILTIIGYILAKKTMKVAILSFEGVVMSSAAGPYDMLSEANTLVSEFRPDIPMETIDVKIIDTQKLNGTSTYDLIIIPAMKFHKIDDVLDREQKTIHWLKRQYINGAEIASICLGAFILASTGLLDHKKATTH